MDDLLRAGGAPRLWLDCDDYAARLFARDAAPWLDVGECVAWQRKAQGLLKSDVVGLPVDRVIDAWLASHGGLRSEMAAKSRAVFPLRTLLADDGLRAHLVDLAKAMRASFSAAVLAVVLPSPRAWVQHAYAQAHGADAAVEIGDDETDSAAMYLADFLRAFGDIGIDAVLLVETPATQASNAEAVSLYQSVFNVATHYRWALGLLQPRDPPLSLPAGDIAFVVAPSAAGVPTGALIGDDFWQGAAAATTASLRYARIPPDAAPERVLDRLAVLRQ